MAVTITSNASARRRSAAGTRERRRREAPEQQRGSSSPIRGTSSLFPQPSSQPSKNQQRNVAHAAYGRSKSMASKSYRDILASARNDPRKPRVALSERAPKAWSPVNGETRHRSKSVSRSPPEHANGFSVVGVEPSPTSTSSFVLLPAGSYSSSTEAALPLKTNGSDDTEATPSATNDNSQVIPDDTISNGDSLPSSPSGDSTTLTSLTSAHTDGADDEMVVETCCDTPSTDMHVDSIIHNDVLVPSSKRKFVQRDCKSEDTDHDVNPAKAPAKTPQHHPVSNNSSNFHTTHTFSTHQHQQDNELTKSAFLHPSPTPHPEFDNASQHEDHLNDENEEERQASRTKKLRRTECTEALCSAVAPTEQAEDNEIEEAVVVSDDEDGSDTDSIIETDLETSKECEVGGSRGRTVRFSDPLVTDTWTRPRLLPSEITSLFYSPQDEERFRAEFNDYRLRLLDNDGHIDEDDATSEDIILADTEGEDENSVDYSSLRELLETFAENDAITEVADASTPSSPSSIISKAVVVHDGTVQTYYPDILEGKVESEGVGFDDPGAEVSLHGSGETAFFDNPTFWNGTVTWY